MVLELSVLLVLMDTFVMMAFALKLNQSVGLLNEKICLLCFI